MKLCLGVALVALLPLAACDAALGVDLCGKKCDSADACGDGFTCSAAGTCESPACPAATVDTTGDGGNQALASSSMNASTGTSGASSAAGTSQGASASSGPLASSGAASSGASASSGTASSAASMASGSSTSRASSGAQASSSLLASSTSAATSSTSAATSSTSAATSSTSTGAGSSSTGGATSSMGMDGGVVSCSGTDAGAACGNGLICVGGSCVAACFIGGTVRQPGVFNPANGCQVCDPAASTTGWSGAPVTVSCLDGNRCTTMDHCDGNGACTAGVATCPSTAPDCTPANGACRCTTVGGDTCAQGTTNKRCGATMQCGCQDNLDCASGERCGGDSRCHACDSLPSACGNACEDCRTLPMTLGEGSRYTCTSNTVSLATACTVTACSSSTANCNGVDDDGCEQDIRSSAGNCSACGLACAAGTACRNGTCDCNPESCPMGQNCQGQACECNSSTECAAGYRCSNNRCVR